ncbi:MAG: glycosyltransferase family 39 protein [Planctomycetota bacterium]|jgi:4-amino-4-deoxy-L-arabinose transferase-like glycosyltransferase
MRRFTGVALLVFLCAFGVRFAAALAVDRDRAMFPDSEEYFAVADNILEGNGIIVHERARAKRLPVYALFLAAHRGVFGDSILPVQVTQALVGAFSCILLLLLARPLLGERAAQAASLALAFYPLHVAVSSAILVETLVTFFLLLEVLLLYMALRDRRYFWAAAAGFAGGVATLLQAGHVLFFLFAVPFVVRAMRPQRAWRVLAVFLCASVVLPALWTVRNAIVLDRVVGLSAPTGKAMYDAFGPGATGGAGHKMHVPPRGARSEVEYDAYMRAEAWKAIRSDPGRAAGLVPQKQRRFWNILPNYEEYRTVVGVLTTLSFAPVLAFFVVALFRLRRLGWDSAWFLAPAAYFALLHCVMLGSIRYRLPIEPFLIALAAWAAVDLWMRLRRRNEPAAG